MDEWHINLDMNTTVRNYSKKNQQKTKFMSACTTINPAVYS